MTHRINDFTRASLFVSLVVTGSWLSGLPTGQAAAAPQATSSRASTTNTVYANGVYTARGWYGSLPSSITVTVTLQGGIITAVKVKPHATDPTSLDLQRRFAAAVPRVVVGKRLADVTVGKLAGSSGTPKGFNDALAKIRQQAKQ